jgi:hypothetical protein
MSIHQQITATAVTALDSFRLNSVEGFLKFEFNNKFRFWFKLDKMDNYKSLITYPESFLLTMMYIIKIVATKMVSDQ